MLTSKKRLVCGESLRVMCSKRAGLIVLVDISFAMPMKAFSIHRRGSTYRRNARNSRVSLGLLRRCGKSYIPPETGVMDASSQLLEHEVKAHGK